MKHFPCGTKWIGLTIFAFGLGLLLSFFLPAGWLVVIEAVVILTIGCICFSSR